VLYFAPVQLATAVKQWPANSSWLTTWIIDNCLQQPFYGSYTAGTPSKELDNFVAAKFYCIHAYHTVTRQSLITLRLRCALPSRPSQPIPFTVNIAATNDPFCCMTLLAIK